jgi:hypothetical protein
MMAIAHDWLEPIDTKDARETQDVDRIMEHWGRWQRANGVHLQAPAAGNILGINAIAHRTWDLSITDDQFTFVDRCVTRLPDRLNAVVVIEYIIVCSQADRWRRAGLLRTAYAQRLNAAQWALVTLFGPFLDDCRQKSVNSAYC